MGDESYAERLGQIGHEIDLELTDFDARLDEALVRAEEFQVANEGSVESLAVLLRAIHDLDRGLIDQGELVRIADEEVPMLVTEQVL